MVADTDSLCNDASGFPQVEKGDSNVGLTNLDMPNIQAIKDEENESTLICK